MIPNFIVVDDDYINNVLSSTIIEMVFPQASILAYTDPETALAYIRSNFANTMTSDTVLFLDINMPTLTGWEFLEAFEQFDTNIKEQLKVYMLSSSVDPRDKERATRNKNVLDYLEKPLTEESVTSAVAKL